MFDFMRTPLFDEADDGSQGGGGGGGGEGSLLRGGEGAAGGGEPQGGEPQGGAGGEGSPNEDFRFGSLLNEDGQFVENWSDQFIEARPDLAQFKETFANYKDPVEALKAFGNTKALVGRNLSNVEAVLNPNPDDPTAMGLYRQTLGIPDEGSPEAYEFRPGEDIKDLVNDETLGEFAKKAHELGLNKKQFAELVNYQAGVMRETGSTLEESLQAQDDSRKEDFWKQANAELGGQEATDKALDLTVRMLRSAGLSDEVIGSEIAPGLHHMGPAFLKAMTALAASTSEDRLPAGGSNASQGISAKEAYRSIMQDPNNPKYAIYRNENHPDHESVRAEVHSLIKKSKQKAR